MKIKNILIFLCIATTTVLSQSFTDSFNNAISYYNNGEYVNAYKVFKKIEKSTEVDKRVKGTSLFYIGDCLASLGNLDGAANYFEKYINENTSAYLTEEAFYKLGAIYFEKERFKKSRDNLEKLIQIFPSTDKRGEVFYKIGKAFFEEGNYDRAEEAYLKSVSLKRRNSLLVYGLYALGNLYEKQGNYSNAVEYYDKILVNHFESEVAPQAQLRIGISYFKLKKYDNVVLELSDPLIDNLPDEQRNEAKLVLANSLFRLKEYENAAKAYNEIIDQFDTGSKKEEIKFGLAWITFQMRDYVSAFDMFQELSESQVDSIKINSLFWSGESKRYALETDGAKKIFSEFIENYPEHRLAAKAKLNIALMDFNEGDIKYAERNLVESLSSDDPGAKARAFTLLGEIKLNKNEYKNAEANFTDALKIDEIDEDLEKRAKLGLGISRYYLDKNDDAISVLSNLSVSDKRFERGKVNFYLAEAFFERRDYVAAIKHYNRVGLGYEDLRKDVLRGKAYSYYNNGEYNDAIYYLSEYLNEYGKNNKKENTRLLLANSYYAQKRFYKASQIYRKVYSSNPKLLNSAYAYYQYSQALFQAGLYNQSINQLAKLQRKYRSSSFAPQAQRLIGWIYFKRQSYNRAIENFLKVGEVYPKSSVVPSSYYLVGDSYYNMGKYDTAIVYYSKLLRDYPNTQYVFDAINGIQYCYLAKDEPSQAVEIIDGYLDENPEASFSPKVALKRADIYYTQEDYTKAIEAYDFIINNYEDKEVLPAAYFGKGESLLKLEQEEKAFESFSTLVNKYLKTDEGIDAVIKVGKILNKNGEYQSAIEVFDNAASYLKESSRLDEILFNKAMIQLDNEKFQDAYASFKYLSDYFNNSVFADQAKVELGIMEIAREEYKSAEELFIDVAGSRTDDIGAKAQYYYGLVLFEQDKIDDAISALVRVRSVFNTYDLWYSKALLLLGDCYKKMENKKLAREMYRAVEKKHKNDQLGKEAKQKLQRL